VPILTNRLLREGLLARLADSGADSGRPSLAELAASEREMVASRIAALLAERQARIDARHLSTVCQPAAPAVPAATSRLAAAE